MHTVEPVLGTLQQYYGLRWIKTRGRDCANKLMLMSASALNLKKWMKNEFEKVKNDLYLVIFALRCTMSDLMPINKIVCCDKSGRVVVGKGVVWKHAL